MGTTLACPTQVGVDGAVVFGRLSGSATVSQDVDVTDAWQLVDSA